MVSSSQGTGASQPSPSVLPTCHHSSTSTPSTSNTGKKILHINLNCSIVDEYAANWHSRSGDFIRIHVPIFFKDWRLVPQNFKDDVWNSLMQGEFEFMFLHIKLVQLQRKRFPNDSVRIKIKSRKETKTTREIGKNKVGHSLGRRTYAQKPYVMRKENLQAKFRRAHSWLKGHERTDGSVLENAKELYETVQAAVENRDANMTSDENDNELEIDNDELTQCIGPGTRGHGIRVVGSCISKKHLQQAVFASSIMKQVTSKSAAKVETDMAGFKTDMDGVKTNMAGIQKNVAEITKNVSQFGNMLNGMCQANGMSHIQLQFDSIPRTEEGSNSVHRPSQLTPRNLFAPFDPLDHPSGMSTRPKVTLLDRDGGPVAKGYVVTGAASGICHGRKVGIGEEKVYVEEVLVGNAAVHDGPQDGNTTLQGFVEGGYLICFHAGCKMIDSLYLLFLALLILC